MTAIDLNSRPARSKDIVVQTMPPDTILLNLDNGYYYSTNGVGAAVWELCDGETTVETMIRQIGARTDAPSERIEADIVGFVERLAKEGLLAV